MPHEIQGSCYNPYATLLIFLFPSRVSLAKDFVTDNKALLRTLTSLNKAWKGDPGQFRLGYFMNNIVGGEAETRAGYSHLTKVIPWMDNSTILQKRGSPPANGHDIPNDTYIKHAKKLWDDKYGTVREGPSEAQPFCSEPIDTHRHLIDQVPPVTAFQPRDI